MQVSYLNNKKTDEDTWVKSISIIQARLIFMLLCHKNRQNANLACWNYLGSKEPHSDYMDYDNIIWIFPWSWAVIDASMPMLVGCGRRTTASIYI